MAPLNILLIDDHTTFLHIARRFLASQPGINLIGEATSADDALQLLTEVHPDVAVIDLAMPGTSGFDLIQNLHAAHPQLGIVALTLFDTKEHREAAINAGAHAFVPKAILRTDLIDAIEQAAQAAGVSN